MLAAQVEKQIENEATSSYVDVGQERQDTSSSSFGVEVDDLHRAAKRQKTTTFNNNTKNTSSATAENSPTTTTAASSPWITAQELPDLVDEQKGNLFKQPWSGGMIKGLNIHNGYGRNILVLLNNTGNNTFPSWPIKQDVHTGMCTIQVPVSRQDADSFNEFQNKLMKCLLETHPQMFGKSTTEPSVHVLAKEGKSPFPDFINVKFPQSNVNQSLEDSITASQGKKQTDAPVFSMVDANNNPSLCKNFDLNNLPKSNWVKAIVQLKHVCSTNGKWGITAKLKALVLRQPEVDEQDSLIEFSLTVGEEK